MNHLEFGRTPNGTLHVLHLLNETPLCGSQDPIVRAFIGLGRDLTWGYQTCGTCVKLAYLQDEDLPPKGSDSTPTSTLLA